MNHKILNILAEIRPEFDFTTSENFILDGMLDSFDIVTLVSTLDNEFSISIDGIDIIPENFANIDKIVMLLQKNGANS